MSLGLPAKIIDSAFLCLLLLVSGCSILPSTIDLPKNEQSLVIDNFRKNISRQRNCSSILDADVTITVKKILSSGVISGYLMGMAPSYLHFEGVNPLGMTEVVVSTDGQIFTLINIRQQKAFYGEMNSKTLKEYFPNGFSASSFYLLIGRLPPGEIKILSVHRDEAGRGFWADIFYENQERSLVLFSETNGLIMENILMEKDGDVLAEFSYSYQEKLTSSLSSMVNSSQDCLLPDRLQISGVGVGSMSVSFTKRYADSKFTADDFNLTIPDEFRREVIK